MTLQIKLDDAMEDEELKFGPNGGLIFCMEYLMENIDWLQRQLGGGIGDDDEVFLPFSLALALCITCPTT